MRLQECIGEGVVPFDALTVANKVRYLSLLNLSRLSIIELILPHIKKQQAKSKETRKNPDQISDLDKSVLLLRTLKLEAQGTMALASTLNTFYIYLSYLGHIPDPASKSPFHEPQLRYELRMKPFLQIRSPELPPFDEWDEVMHPFGDYYDTNPLFLATKQEYLNGMDASIKKAKIHFAELKKLGAVAAGCEGVEEAWGKVISSII